MKLTILIRSLNRGGAERQVSLLAREMQQQGHDVCVAVFYPGAMDAELISAGVRIVYLGKRHRWDIFGFMSKVMRFVGEERPEIIYSFLTVGNLISGLLKLWYPSLKVIWGVRASALDITRYDSAIRLSVMLERKLAFVPNGIISNSRAGLDALGIPKGQQTAVIANGVDTDAFYPDPEGRRRLRQEWGIADDELLIGLVARIDPMKDHDTFLEAAAIMRKSRNKLRFICVGDTTPYDHQRLTELTRRHGIHDLIYNSSRPDIRAVYSALDLLVLSSAYGEGCPNVITESAACGTPAVVTDIGASAELVGDSRKVVPPRQPQALATACLNLMDSPQFGSAETARTLRDRVIEHYATSKLVNATLKAIHDMTFTASPALSSLYGPRTILMVVGSLKFGGAERHLLTIAPALKARGWNPAIYVLSGRGALAGDMVQAGIPILGGLSASPWFQWLPRPLRGLMILLDLIRVMLFLHPSVCHCFLPQSCIIGGVSGMIAAMRNVVMSRRSLNNYQAADPLMAGLERYMMRHTARAVLGNSRAIIEQLKEEGVPASQLGLIYSGLDLVNQGTLQPDKMREAEQISPSSFVMTIIANLHDYKGHSHLFEALGRIKDQLPPDWVLLCVGGDAGCLETLIEQRGRLGMTANIRFLGSRPDAAELWRISDLGLLVSLEEGFPMSLLEGMAAGLPMVVTDVGGSPEALGDCGKIVPPANPVALAEAILAYANDPELRRRDGEKAKNRIQSKFTLDACVDGYENLYLGLLNNKAEPIQQLIDAEARN